LLWHPDVARHGTEGAKAQTKTLAWQQVCLYGEPWKNKLQEVGSMEPLTLTIQEAARALGITRNTAYAAARDGDLPTIRIRNRILVPKAALERLLDSAGKMPPKEGKAA
jgi:excisionase family DNA binding protein